MTRLRNPRRRWPQPIVWLLLGLGIVHPYQPPQQAMAQASKPVVHVFLQLDAKSSVVEKTLHRSFQNLDLPTKHLLGVDA
jgi:hypothetical protein